MVRNVGVMQEWFWLVKDKARVCSGIAWARIGTRPAS